jgi:hypothetical protein
VKNILLATLLVSAVVLSVSGGHALAAKPANHACLGQSVSVNAKAMHPYGALVSDSAKLGGVGGIVQGILAGQVSDADYPNSCTD